MTNPPPFCYHNVDRMERSDLPMIRSYESFLRGLRVDLEEAVRVSENEEWHHKPDSDERYKCYLRLLTWQAEVTARLDGHKARKRTGANPGKSPAQEDGVV